MFWMMWLLPETLPLPRIEARGQTSVNLQREVAVLARTKAWIDYEDMDSPDTRLNRTCKESVNTVLNLHSAFCVLG